MPQDPKLLRPLPAAAAPASNGLLTEDGVNRLAAENGDIIVQE
jgi:hypothetical protein